MIEHLGINTPYFGILLSLIPFIIATMLLKRQTAFSYSHRYLYQWL